MTRYGFAIKALPKGGRPFGDDEEDPNDTPGAENGPSPGEADPAAPAGQPVDSLDDLPPDPAAPSSTPADGTDPAAPTGDGADPAAAADTPPEGADSGQTPDTPPQPTDDSRPWSGDMYDAGDETDPQDAYAAYTGSAGEQAWLDRDPDGTLTGWVRDSTGQVWRYTDADAWAQDVDGAQMTRTHGPDGEDGAADPAATNDPAQPADRGVQESMFTGQ